MIPNTRASSIPMNHAAPSPTLWLARHAVVTQGAGRCYGRLDWPADAAATQAAAQALARRLPAHVCVAQVSPRRRCVQLAEALAALRPGLRWRVDARLAEMDFGAWEGQTWEEIGRTAMDAWLADFMDARAGGGESVRAFMARVGAAWDEWRANGNGDGGSGDALWLTHAGVMRAALLLARGVRLPAASEWPAHVLSPGQVLCLNAAEYQIYLT